jgi:hypothetical protein
MGRPRTLTDEERKRSNALRQARWRKNNKGYARLKVRNDHARRRREGQGVEVAFEEPVKKKVGPQMVRYGELRHVPLHEAEGNREVMEEHQKRLEKFRPPGGVPVKESPNREVESTQNEIETYERLIEMAARRKKAREVEVPVEG